MTTSVEDLDILVGMVEQADVIQFNEETQELTSENGFVLSLTRTEFNDDKDMMKFIRAVEGLVRKMPEYKDWTSYIKDTLGYYSCAITGEVASQVTIDIHHHPVSMFAIVRGVLMQYINAGKSFSSLDIVKDVIELHYKGKVGYIPLIRSLHEKLHNGYLALPMELIKGDWKYTAYNFDHDDKEIEVITARVSINKSNCGWGDQYFWVKDAYKEPSAS